MQSRSYNKFEDVLARLREHLVNLKGKGESLAPGERELATLLQASRGTVAKALQQLENEKFIVRDKKGTNIQAFAQRRSYAYVATVHRSNDTFWFHAYYRLWQRLEMLLRNSGIKIALYKLDPEDERQSVDAQLTDLAGVDTVFVSLLCNVQTSMVVKKLKSMGCQVILLDENDLSPDTPLIGLDNFAVGKLAVDLLHKAGYCNLALMAPHINWRTNSFRERLQGFNEAACEQGVEYQVFGTNSFDEFAELAAMSKCVNELPEMGFDCAFFITDEHIELADSLIKRRLVPAKFGLLAFDGVMKARAHQPPVDCLSHGTDPLADAIMEIILKQEAGGDAIVEGRKVQPKHYPGKTLRNA